MGCCVSSAAADNEDELLSGKNMAPPQSVVEEETEVKEVLSETTFLTSCDDNSTLEKKMTTTKIPEEEEKKHGIVDTALDPVLVKPSSIEPGKGLEVSEMCSLSESLLSIVNGYGEEEVKQSKTQGVRHSSPAKSRNRVLVNYQVRRSDMSPHRRNAEGGGAVCSTERAERRSRSPAMDRSVMIGPNWNQKSMDCGGAMRKRSQSAGRVRPNPNKNGSEHHQWPGCGTAGGNYNSTPNDSFDNPFVSLECFIFL